MSYMLWRWQLNGRILQGLVTVSNVSCDEDHNVDSCWPQCWLLSTTMLTPIDHKVDSCWQLWVHCLQTVTRVSVTLTTAFYWLLRSLFSLIISTFNWEFSVCPHSKITQRTVLHPNYINPHRQHYSCPLLTFTISNLFYHCCTSICR